MKTKDYTRNSSVHFHAIGLSSYTDDKFMPRRDMYVKDNTTWTIMTLNLIKIALGHRDVSICLRGPPLVLSNTLYYRIVSIKHVCLKNVSFKLDLPEQ
jgi:hypothetical protein